MFRSKSQAELLDRVGEVQDAPTTNTILARLRNLLTNIVLGAGSAIIGKVGIDQTTPGVSNKVVIDSVPATDFEGGKITVGTSAVEVTFTGATKAIHLEADHDNAGHIYQGKSNVASDGSNAVARLNAGESIGWDYDDSTNPIYVVASQADQVAYKLALLA